MTIKIRDEKPEDGANIRAIVSAGLDRAAREGWQAVFVLGEPEYDRRFGFDLELASGFSSPYAGPYSMVISLTGDLLVTSGQVDYAKAFGAL